MLAEEAILARGVIGVVEVLGSVGEDTGEIIRLLLPKPKRDRSVLRVLLGVIGLVIGDVDCDTPDAEANELGAGSDA